MLANLIAFCVAFFAILATATEPPVTVTVTSTVTAPAATETVSQCNTGSTQCCTSVQSSSSDLITSLFGLLDIVLGDITGLVGLGCTPISILGLGSGANCAQQPVCCTNVTFNGLINIGCTAISL
ncbi:hypothetical protein M422DRAFT_269392 [Sphaerobolus stellatus SS14]|uniref:Hydrophobin n=1 Tax=Sphaerobolus stellatus (strain SS14) TaxID=990650 RepID=A0A0C9UJZ8_SPHS4|nr:hypothetical protein M422DRAFT_269392 [Sphaerobolus stellatus SS14]